MTSPSDEDLINIGTKYFYYKSRAGSGGGIQAQMDDVDKKELDKELRVLKDKITLAQIEEETYNEMYLNSKKNPNTFGLFSKVGLRTTQDWLLAYFFFSYIVFSIFIILHVLRTSTNATLTIVTLLGILTVVGVLFTIAILTYG